MEALDRAGSRSAGDQGPPAGALSVVSLSHARGALQREVTVNNGEFPAARGGRAISAGLTGRPAEPVQCFTRPACRDSACRAMKRP